MFELLREVIDSSFLKTWKACWNLMDQRSSAFFCLPVGDVCPALPAPVWGSGFMAGEFSP